MKIYTNIFEKIISLENLFDAWEKFKRDKGKRKDVQGFEFNLEENIFKLYRELQSGNYNHGVYKPFYIQDPKQRLIHKAAVRDRIVHHAIFSILNPIFERTFIPNSFSCRVGKGTHKGVNTLKNILRKVSINNTLNCFALKCDIKKFFDSIDHKILLSILERKIKNERAVCLLNEVIESYSNVDGSGMPIGNLTSQLFANIYLNEFDQFIKCKLRVKNYIRYTDDFIVVSNDEKYLYNLIFPINDFLRSNLKLYLHPRKTFVRKYERGIDFLGYVILPHYLVVRTKTKKRIFKRINNRNISSYLGVLSHASCYKLAKELVSTLKGVEV